MIPDEAVEAAARVMHAQDDALNDVGEFDLEVYRHDVTAILEAAAPHIIAAHFREKNRKAIAHEIETPLQFRKDRTSDA